MYSSLGSECPPLKENQLRLYNMRFCPYAQRAKLVLAAKNIPLVHCIFNDF
jgi:glutaredoxin